MSPLPFFCRYVSICVLYKTNLFGLIDQWQRPYICAQFFFCSAHKYIRSSRPQTRNPRYIPRAEKLGTGRGDERKMAGGEPSGELIHGERRAHGHVRRWEEEKWGVGNGLDSRISGCTNRCNLYEHTRICSLNHSLTFALQIVGGKNRKS